MGMLLLSKVFMLREMSESVAPRRCSADMVGGGGTCLGWCTGCWCTPWLAADGTGGAAGAANMSCSKVEDGHMVGVRSTMGADVVERGG